MAEDYSDREWYHASQKRAEMLRRRKQDARKTWLGILGLVLLLVIIGVAILHGGA